MLPRTLTLALDGTQPACLTVHSQTSAQEALKHTPEQALKYTSNCTRWYTPSLVGSTLPSTLPISLDYGPMYAPACSIQRLAELQTPGTGTREASGVL